MKPETEIKNLKKAVVRKKPSILVSSTEGKWFDLQADLYCTMPILAEGKKHFR